MLVEETWFVLIDAFPAYVARALSLKWQRKSSFGEFQFRLFQIRTYHNYIVNLLHSKYDGTNISFHLNLLLETVSILMLEEI